MKNKIINNVLYFVEKWFSLISKDIRLLRFFSPFMPTDKQLEFWSKSDRHDYQLWIKKHTILTQKDWIEAHIIARRRVNHHKISIITPVYNPPVYFLEECIASVQLQTSPYWEWILVDDGSTDSEVLAILNSAFSLDPRIKVIFSETNQAQGISKNTNRGIKVATGDYILFLDHDDRLELDAIALLHQAIEAENNDILYSDRDMITLDNKHDFHLMKPNWSPETLLSGNYIFHLMCYKTTFLNKIGWLDSQFDGSQDYDLVLRASEVNPKVKHIPNVLYHWRQHESSVSENVNAKAYAFDAGVRALTSSLKRRKIDAKVIENKAMPRGIYQIIFEPVTINKIQIIQLDRHSKVNYKQQIKGAIKEDSSIKYIMILDKEIVPEQQNTIAKMAAWMQFKKIGLISGKLINEQDILSYAGIFYTQEAQLLYTYQYHHKDQQGYMGVTHITRNISIPNPYCVLINKALWQQLEGFSSTFNDTLTMLDFSFNALEQGWRIIYQPDAVFQHNNHFDDFTFYSLNPLFKEKWQQKINQGDPYYNPNLCQDCNEMGLPESKYN